jgi:hypothetical protein
MQYLPGLKNVVTDILSPFVLSIFVQTAKFWPLPSIYKINPPPLYYMIYPRPNFMYPISGQRSCTTIKKYKILGLNISASGGRKLVLSISADSRQVLLLSYVAYSYLLAWPGLRQLSQLSLRPKWRQGRWCSTAMTEKG